MRRPVDPNKVEQDGPKAWLMCDACEQAFSRRESLFAREVFHPWMDNRASPKATSADTHYFLVSLLWRALIMYVRKEHAEAVPWRERLAALQDSWRRYLAQGGEWCEPEYVHLLLMDVFEPAAMPVVNMNRYTATVIDFTVATSATSCMVYAKMGVILAIAQIAGFDGSLWLNTRIPSRGGVFTTPQAVRDGRLMAFMADRARGSHEMYQAGLSEAQREAIARRHESASPGMRGGLLERALNADRSIEVDPTIGRSTPIGADEGCPCGSGHIYRLCHGA